MTTLAGLWAFFVGSPAKLALYFSNRALTWTGLLVLWRKLEGNPARRRRFVFWLFLINSVSFGLLILSIRTFAPH